MFGVYIQRALRVVLELPKETLNTLTVGYTPGHANRYVQDLFCYCQHQSGYPSGTGAGGPGYKFQDELPPKHSYDTGIVATANSGSNTNGSQFFICTGPESQNLNSYPNYTQFGQVVEGMDIVHKIAAV